MLRIISLLCAVSTATCYVLIFPPDSNGGLEEIDFIGRNSFADKSLIVESSINREKLTNENRMKYGGVSNRMEENIGKALLKEVREEEDEMADGWNSRVMVNGKTAHLGRPAEEEHASATIRTWLIHYCRLHPKCNLQTLLAEL